MTYQFNSIVNKSEAESLKEMIFSRARERAKNMNEDVQSDIMDLARESFADKNNPFSLIAESKAEGEIKDTVEAPKTTVNSEIGFPKRNVEARISGQNRVLNEQLSSSTIANNMEEARTALSNKKSFMGALNFLNSQAAISLARTRADKFEIVA